MAYARKVSENMDKLLKDGRKKFVRYESIVFYGLHSFQELAKDAGAV